MDTSIRKRVCRACDRCRLKKSKCDGSKPCTRCKADNAICVFGVRRKLQDKTYPNGYIEALERQQAQLTKGLRELYRQTQNGGGWIGKPLDDHQGRPLTHDILNRLGALEHDDDGASETYEEDLSLIQQGLIEGETCSMERQDSTDRKLDQTLDRSPSFNLMPPQKPVSQTPSTLYRPPLTPSLQSPDPHMARVPLHYKDYSKDINAASVQHQNGMHSTMDPTVLHRQSGTQPSTDYHGDTDFVRNLIAPMNWNSSMSMQFSNQLPLSADMSTSCLNVPDWNEEDFSGFINFIFA